MPSVLKNIIRFVLLVLAQVLLLNSIQFLGYINPYIYIYAILVLAARTPRWLVLLVAFALGLSIDMFSNTPGLHTFATVFVAFIRYPVVRFTVNLEEGADPEPSVLTFGWGAYLRYAAVLVVFHNALIFTIEAFSLVNYGIILLKILCSSLVTLLLIVAGQMLKRKK